VDPHIVGYVAAGGFKKKTLALPRHWCRMNAFSLYFVCGAKEREREGEKQIERKRVSERESEKREGRVE